MEFARTPGGTGPYSVPCVRCGKRAGVSISGPSALKVDCPDCGQFDATWEELVKAWQDPEDEEPHQP